MKKYSHKEFTEEAAKKSIDVFISCSSFESRCFIIPNLIDKIAPKESIFFCNTNECREIVENAEKLKSNISSSSIIELNSDEPVKNLFVISEFINRKTAQYSKPNILIDTTTFTHETLLVLIRLIHLRRESIGKIFIAYVVAGKYSTNSKTDEERWLSKGIQEIRTILGYSGFTDPTKEDHLVLLFGFESERTKRIIDEYEYKNVSLGFGDNYTVEGHLKINYERHSKLIQEYPHSNKFKFSLLDPLEAKKNILDYLNQPNFKDMNTVIAPLNNKISTIGAGLAAIENPNIQLAYAKPILYNIAGYSEPNEDIYFGQLDM